MSIKLDRIFADGMILQRDKEICVWGEVVPEAESCKTEHPETKVCADEIQVTFDGQTVTAASANGDGGHWMAKLKPHSAGTGFALSVRYRQECVTINDIAVGDVWVAGGQSNMEFYLKYEQHVWQGRYPEFNDNIRFYDVPEVAFDGQEQAFDYSRMAVWRKAASIEDLDYFSAVGFYFAQKVYASEQVPIGILGCNWGGTAILGWMDPETVNKVGQPWWEETQRRLAGMDLDTYYRLQVKDPMNDTGNPMLNPFTVYMLPVARGDEEANAYLASVTPVVETEIPTVGGLPVDGSEPPLQPQKLPGALYEHMVKKISDFPVKGFLYYQGESDDETSFGPGIYDKMFSGMIDDWRTLWKDETLPFLAVQLAPFRHWLGIDAGDYVTLRQKQADVAKEKEQVYLASIGDVGMELDIHPKDKKTVGERLALLALGHGYGRELLCEAPAVKCVSRSSDGTEIEIKFDHAGEGLYLEKDRELPLQILDDAGNALPFRYEASGDVLKITLREKTDRPLKVLFARTNWYSVNLYNSAGIPAFPFACEVDE